MNQQPGGHPGRPGWAGVNKQSGKAVHALFPFECLMNIYQFWFYCTPPHKARIWLAADWVGVRGWAGVSGYQGGIAVTDPNGFGGVLCICGGGFINHPGQLSDNTNSIKKTRYP